MSVMTEKTVGELALGNLGATRVFEKLGIDYCCGGGQTLEQACQAAHASVNQVADSLAEASRLPASPKLASRASFRAAGAHPGHAPRLYARGNRQAGPAV